MGHVPMFVVREHWPARLADALKSPIRTLTLPISRMTLVLRHSARQMTKFVALLLCGRRAVSL